MKLAFAAILAATTFCFSCKKPVADKDDVQERIPITLSYHLEDKQAWLQEQGGDTSSLQLAYALNRTDSANFLRMDTVIIAEDMSAAIKYYLPFPLKVPYLRNIKKLIFFSYATQTFATYENGRLIHTGPTNMGRKADPTPLGLFFTNWKAEKTISTFNDEWDLYWNFNIANKEGVGWHQYSLPGLPLSHSCLRLQERDARYLYAWADEWIVGSADTVSVKGTPVIVFGSYDFKAAKPWLKLLINPHAIDISLAEIQSQTAPFYDEILTNQNRRDSLLASKL